MLPIYTVLDVFESRRWFMPSARLECDRSNILLNSIITNYTSNTKHTGLWSLTLLSTIIQLYIMEEETGVPGENHRPIARHR